MVELLLLLVSLVLVAGCGLFVMAEFSLIASNRGTVERLAAKGDVRAKGVLRALRSLSTQLSSAQVGITITNLAIGFLAEPAIAYFLRGPLRAAGLPEVAVGPSSIAVGIALATAVTMVFGELVPKNIAIAKPLTAAKRVQGPLLFFTAVMRLPIRALNGSANWILARFGVEPQEELASARSADELLSLVRRSAEKGTLAKETATMVERSINFGELLAVDVMTPRVRVQSLQADMTASHVLALSRRTGFSRFPVYGKSLDDVRGVVHIKQAFAVPYAERDTMTVDRILRQPVLMPSTIELEPLMEALRRGGLQMAVLIDEFGGVAGIVTMEDLLEELVGEVHDEHDRTKATMRRQSDGSWLLSGLLRPDEIAKDLDVVLPDDDDTETIGGLLVQRLERLPVVGDSVAVEAVNRDGQDLLATMRVERMDGYRVDRISLSWRPLSQDTDSAGVTR